MLRFGLQCWVNNFFVQQRKKLERWRRCFNNSFWQVKITFLIILKNFGSLSSYPYTNQQLICCIIFLSQYRGQEQFRCRNSTITFTGWIFGFWGTYFSWHRNVSLNWMFVFNFFRRFNIGERNKQLLVSLFRAVVDITISISLVAFIPLTITVSLYFANACSWSCVSSLSPCDGFHILRTGCFEILKRIPKS